MATLIAPDHDAVREAPDRTMPMIGNTSRYGRSPPAIHHRQIPRERVDKDHKKKGQQADRQARDKPVRKVAGIALAFLHQPAGAEQRVAEAKPTPHSSANGLSQPKSPPV